MEDDDVGHEVVVVHLDLQLLRHLVETVADRVLALQHHSDAQTDLALKVDPVGDEGTHRFGLLSLLQYAHQDVGESDQHGRMLEELSVLGVAADVGDAERVGSNEMVSLHDVPRLAHQHLCHPLIALHLSAQLLCASVKQVIGLPEAAYVVLGEGFVLDSALRRSFKHCHQQTAEIGSHERCSEVDVTSEGHVSKLKEPKLLS